MKVIAKRGRFPASTKRRLKHLAAELREQVRHEDEMAEARKNSPYYQAAIAILRACDWYYHEGLDIDTVMWLISEQLHYWVYVLKHDNPTKGDMSVDRNPERLPRQDYEQVVIYTRHELRAHDSLGANMMYLLDNTVGMWYDGYYSDKLAMNLLLDYATVLASGWSGRRQHLAYKRGR